MSKAPVRQRNKPGAIFPALLLGRTVRDVFFPTFLYHFYFKMTAATVRNNYKHIRYHPSCNYYSSKVRGVIITNFIGRIPEKNMDFHERAVLDVTTHRNGFIAAMYVSIHISYYVILLFMVYIIVNTEKTGRKLLIAAEISFQNHGNSLGEIGKIYTKNDNFVSRPCVTVKNSTCQCIYIREGDQVSAQIDHPEVK